MGGRGFMSEDATRKVSALGRKIIRFAAKLATDDLSHKPVMDPSAPAGIHHQEAHELGNLIAQAIMGASTPDDMEYREGQAGAEDYATALFFATGMSFAIGAFLATVPIDQQEETIAIVKGQMDKGQVDFTHTMFRPNA